MSICKYIKHVSDLFLLSWKAFLPPTCPIYHSRHVFIVYCSLTGAQSHNLVFRWDWWVAKNRNVMWLWCGGMWHVTCLSHGPDMTMMSHMCHMDVMCMSHGCHMVVKWISHGGHMNFTWGSHGCHMDVTWGWHGGSHRCHKSIMWAWHDPHVTWVSHGGHMWVSHGCT